MSNTGALHNINEFIRHLLSAVAGAALYTANHPQVHRLAQAAHTSLIGALAERPDIALLEIEGELVIDGEPQPFSLVLDRFVQVMREQGIGHLGWLVDELPQHGDRQQIRRDSALLGVLQLVELIE